jgi:hypothetical protein
MVKATRQLDLPPPAFLEQHEVVVIFRNGMAPQIDVTAQLNPRQLLGLRLTMNGGASAVQNMPERRERLSARLSTTCGKW